MKQDGKWGFIDKTGNTAIPFGYDMAYFFINGEAHVKKGDKEFYIDPGNKKTGEAEKEDEGDEGKDRDRK